MLPDSHFALIMSLEASSIMLPRTPTGLPAAPHAHKALSHLRAFAFAVPSSCHPSPWPYQGSPSLHSGFCSNATSSDGLLLPTTSKAASSTAPCTSLLILKPFSWPSTIEHSISGRLGESLWVQTQEAEWVYIPVFHLPVVRTWAIFHLTVCFICQWKT